VGGLTITRDAGNGLFTGSTLGGVSSVQTNNQFGEPTSTAWSFGSASLYQTSYTRDAIGRIANLTETIGGQSASYGFSYDSVGRLVEVTRDNSPFQSYVFDANGNRLRVTSPSGTAIGSYDAQDRLVAFGDAQFHFGLDGDLREKIIGNDTTKYGYDALGNLLSVRLPDGTQIAYVVDGANRRVGRKVNGTLVQGFLYLDELRPVAELDGAGAVVARFAYGTLNNVPDFMSKGGRTYRFVTDHVGSVRLVVDVQTGDVAQRIDYDPNGRVTSNTNPGFQPFAFAGGLYDSATELTRFGARDYDASAGRWTNRDPILFNGGDTNLYSYVAQDPVNAIDPQGTFSLPELEATWELDAEISSQQIIGSAVGCVNGALDAAAEKTRTWGSMVGGCAWGGVVGAVAGNIGARMGALADESLPTFVNAAAKCLMQGGLDLAFAGLEGSRTGDYVAVEHYKTTLLAGCASAVGGVPGLSEYDKLRGLTQSRLMGGFFATLHDILYAQAVNTIIAFDEEFLSGPIDAKK
jgi:RHS repeat-associated protein